jgi:hypothetical protein
VVPVTILVPGAVPDEAVERLRLAPPQAPAWWLDPAVPTAASADSAVPSTPAPSSDRARSRPAPDLRKRPEESALTLFDELIDAVSAAAKEPDEPRSPSSADPAPAQSRADGVATRVLKSSVYAAQKKVAAVSLSPTTRSPRC